MTRTKFIRLSGWGMVFAAVSLLLSFLPEANKMLEGIRSIAFPVAITLITLGLVGLYIRYGEQVGKTAKMGFGIGILGGAAALVINVGMIMGFEIGRPVLNISMAFMFAGLFIFGLDALRKKPMQRANGLPALAGLLWPALVIQAYVFPKVTRPLGPVFPAWLSFTIFLAMSFFLAWLGYLLQMDVPQEDEIACHQA